MDIRTFHAHLIRGEYRESSVLVDYSKLGFVSISGVVAATPTGMTRASVSFLTSLTIGDTAPFSMRSKEYGWNRCARLAGFVT